MAVKNLQITQTGAAIPISGTPLKCKWVTFQNNAAAVMRVGDGNTTATRGFSLAAGASYSPPVPIVATFGTDLSQWLTIGTATQVLDVIYDDMNF